jgi:phosphoglycerate dehydrogenase-like enzyme
VDQPWRVLALAPMPLEVLQALFADPRLEIFAPTERTQAAVEAALPHADLVIADWSPQLQVIDPGERVCFIQQPSVGYDGLDVDACATRGVPVANCAGANSASVAEWCVSAALALLRQTVEADAAVRRGEWPQVGLPSRELASLKVGIIGMGAIGKRLGALFSAFGCGVSYWSRSQHADAPVPYLPLEELLATSDIVVVVIALGDQSRGLLNRERFAQLKHGAYVVNGARGEVIDDAALIEALESGKAAGAALDAFAIEPLPLDSPLRSAPRILLSPHIAGSTGESAMRIIQQAKANLLRVVAGEPVVDVVNGVAPRVQRRTISP